MAKHSKVVRVDVNLDSDLRSDVLEVSVTRKLDDTLAYTGCNREVVPHRLRKYSPSHIRLMQAAWANLTHEGAGGFSREED